MKIIDKSKFNALRTPTNPKEPVADIVGVHKLSTMVAHKTKFRVADVEEVIKETTYAIYSLLLQRKSVDLNGVKLVNRWVPYDEPKYIRNGEGFWTFGYFFPKIEMSKDGRMIYRGADGEYNKDFIDAILPYLPDGIVDENDIINMAKEIIEETNKLGKEMIVDEEGYIIPKGKKKKRIKFDETFHPSWEETIRYQVARKKLIVEYWEKKKNGEEVPPTLGEYVVNGLLSQGFRVGPDRREDSDGV